MMTECESFIAMLDRSGTGYGLRYDPLGKTAVMVECENSGASYGWSVSEFCFDSEGNLIDDVKVYDGDQPAS